MGLPAAVQDDNVVGVDIHIVLVPAPPAPPVPTPLPHPFAGKLDTNLSTSVKIGGKFAATLGSIATNNPQHVPTPPGTAFAVGNPLNKGPVILASFTVMINGKPAARVGDLVLSCGEPPAPTSTIVGPGVATVLIG